MHLEDVLESPQCNSNECIGDEKAKKVLGLEAGEEEEEEDEGRGSSSAEYYASSCCGGGGIGDGNPPLRAPAKTAGSDSGVSERRRRPISAIPRHLRQQGAVSSSMTPLYNVSTPSLCQATAPTITSTSGFRVTSGCYDNVAQNGASTSPRSTRSDVSVSVDESTTGDKDSGVGTTRSSTGSRYGLIGRLF